MTSDTTKLRRRFDKLTTEAAMDPTSASKLFEHLVEAYGEPQRHYHTLSHLEHMFAKQDEAELDDDACAWATWFHDAVYMPGKSTNEKRSAEMAVDRLSQLGATSVLIERTKDLILATQKHNCDDKDEIAHLFLDSDMAILGEGPDLYGEYVKGIRQEFCQVPSFLFNRGRKAFLKDILSREHIFLSDYFCAVYEESARRNLSDELTSLS